MSVGIYNSKLISCVKIQILDSIFISVKLPILDGFLEEFPLNYEYIIAFNISSSSIIHLFVIKKL